VQVFDRDGRFLRVIGGPTPEKPAGQSDFQGTFARIAGVAVANGRLFVADAYQSRVQVLTTSGRFVAFAGRPGSAAGETYLPLDVAVDSAGRLLVANAMRREITVLADPGEGR
jgi:DNA-binding beta-propeller fold protein YncE